MPRIKYDKRAPLNKWFYNLPHSKLKEAKLFIIKQCGINEPTWYRWMSGRTPIPVSSQIVLNQISGKRLFDIPETVSITSILQEVDA